MRTGRPRQPAELQRLKGDPSKRGKGVLEREAAAEAEGAGGASEVLAPAVFDTPEYLTHERERTIFQRITRELLPRNIIRQTDFGVVARYAVYMHRWIAAKEDLDQAARDLGKEVVGWYSTDSTNGAGGVKMLRRHPAAVDMLDLGAELIKLETMIGLTPMARQSLMRGLQSLPKGAGGLFDQTQPRAQPEDAASDAEVIEPPASPRGFLAPASTTRN